MTKREIVLAIVLSLVCASGWAQYLGPVKGTRYKVAAGTTTATIITAAGGGYTTHTLQAKTGTLAHSADLPLVDNLAPADGVLDLAGRMNIVASTSADADHVITIANNRTPGGGSYTGTLEFLLPNLVDTATAYFRIGQAKSTRNAASIDYYRAGAGSTSNRLSFSFYGVANVLNLLASGLVAINSTTPIASGRLTSLDSTNPQLVLAADADNFVMLRAEADGDFTLTPSDNNIDFDGDVYISGYLTVNGGSDPPYELFFDESREHVLELCRRNVPPSRANGLAQFFNAAQFRLEYLHPATGKYYKVDGAGGLTEVDQVRDGLPCYATDIAVSYRLDPATGEARRIEKPRKPRYTLKATAVMDPATGAFYDRATSATLTRVEALLVREVGADGRATTRTLTVAGR